MGKKILLLSILLGFGTCWAAGGIDLDNEGKATNVAPSFEGTVILRVNTTDNSTAILTTTSHPQDANAAAALAINNDNAFIALAKNRYCTTATELDCDSSVPSWHFRFGFYPGVGFGYNPAFGYNPGFGYAPSYGYLPNYGYAGPGFGYGSGLYGATNPYLFAPSYVNAGIGYNPYFAYGVSPYNYYFFGGRGFRGGFRRR